MCTRMWVDDIIAWCDVRCFKEWDKIYENGYIINSLVRDFVRLDLYRDKNMVQIVMFV